MAKLRFDIRKCRSVLFVSKLDWTSGAKKLYPMFVRFACNACKLCIELRIKVSTSDAEMDWEFAIIDLHGTLASPARIYSPEYRHSSRALDGPQGGAL